MSLTALASFDDDDDSRGQEPPMDVTELDALYRELYRLLRASDREGDR